MNKSSLLILASTWAFAATAQAVPTLYYSPTNLNSGLGRPSSNTFTTSVVNAFGAGNVVQVADFSNTASFSQADALFINAREMTDTLSVQERTNISNFATAGGAVFFVGEHGGWTGWNNSFLGLYGDSYTPWNGVNAAISTNALPGQFTANHQVNLSGPGGIAGGHGTALFTAHYGGFGMAMAAVYGPQNNVIAFLDTNVLASGNSNNVAFYGQVSSWLYNTASAHDTAQSAPPPPPAPVPDSGPGLAFVGALLTLGLARRYCRR